MNDEQIKEIIVAMLNNKYVGVKATNEDTAKEIVKIIKILQDEI